MCALRVPIRRSRWPQRTAVAASPESSSAGFSSVISTRLDPVAIPGLHEFRRDQGVALSLGHDGISEMAVSLHAFIAEKDKPRRRHGIRISVASKVVPWQTNQGRRML